MYTFREINVLHANRYLYNLNQVYITEKTTTSPKLIFSSRETGIYLLISTNFFKINIFNPWSRYSFLEFNVHHKNRYFYNLKRVYNFGNQHTSSKLIFLKPETGIHFWKSTYFFKINILIPWKRYTFLEITILHQNWYLYNLNQVYISGKTTSSSKLIFS